MLYTVYGDHIYGAFTANNAVCTPYIRRVGQNHIYTVYGVYTFLAGKSPNIQSYTAYIYCSGQPYIYRHVEMYGLRRPYVWTSCE